jgi:two-component system sensor histidine kinase ChvG
VLDRIDRNPARLTSSGASHGDADPEDMTTTADIAAADAAGAPRWRGLTRLRRRTGRLLRGIVRRSLSSLARRILLLNLGGLVLLLLGFLWINQTRLSVIDSRVQSLFTQGEIIAAAIAGSATLNTDAISIDPERLLQQQTGEQLTTDDGQSVEFSIDPVQVGPVLRRLVVPTRLRARVYDRDGSMLIDTRGFYAPGDISRLDEPPPPPETPTLVERAWSAWKRRFGRAELTLNDETGTRVRPYQEVTRALGGTAASVVRLSASGATIASVAVPIQRARNIRGALMLSTQEGDIDAVIAEERENILILFGVVTAVMMLLSLLMANTIARPMERLAEGAERVRRSVKSRHQIPDFSDRSDEIGHLSASLREMTNALYRRLESIESFAADVAHELKNPLTSLRSAVETLPLARTEDSRARLLAVIQHDVRRLDRLISDISDASRLDAEMARSEAEPVDVARLLTAVVSVANEIRKPDDPVVQLHVSGGRAGDRFFVMGHDSRLGQVITNLLDNARSFSPPGARIRISCARLPTDVRVIVDDDGPGVPAHALERIFERFYTDRPEQGFGQNSGLGLSISRQIVEAHRGRIWAENRLDAAGEIAGARFTLVLPAAGERRRDAA